MGAGPKAPGNSSGTEVAGIPYRNLFWCIVGPKPRKEFGETMKALAMPRRRRGFTLIEMLAVAIIIGILALIAIPAIINAREQAATAACAANRKLIITAINNWKVRTGKAVTEAGKAAMFTEMETNGYLSPQPECSTKSGTKYTLTTTAVNDSTTGQPSATKVEVTCPGDHSASKAAALL
jgi:prepilin-type N-terminal cleavage/methylation domain-containing protein